MAADGIADALGSDDRNPLIEWRYEQRKGAPAVREGRRIVVPAEWGVEIEIREREPLWERDNPSPVGR